MTELVKPPPALKKTPLSSSQSRLPNQRLGRQGELKAISYLKKHQFAILGQNVRCARDEIDIIAYDPLTSEVVFIEVKTRSSTFFGHPTSALTNQKRRAMIRAATTWMRLQQRREDFRFDSVSLVGSRLRHDRNITW